MKAEIVNGQLVITVDMEHTMNAEQPIDRTQARIHYADGHVEHFTDQRLAYACWLALPPATFAAFRGANDQRPVLDYTAAPLGVPRTPAATATP
jgi:hypothetical protein